MTTQNDNASYKLEIKADSGYESTEEGVLTLGQYGDICKILTGKYVAVEKGNEVYQAMIFEIQKFSDELGLIGMIGSPAWKLQIQNAVQEK